MYCFRIPGKSEGICIGWFPRATVLLPGILPHLSLELVNKLASLGWQVQPLRNDWSKAASGRCPKRLEASINYLPTGSQGDKRRKPSLVSGAMVGLFCCAKMVTCWPYELDSGIIVSRHVYSESFNNRHFECYNSMWIVDLKTRYMQKQKTNPSFLWDVGLICTSGLRFFVRAPKVPFFCT